MNVPGLTGTWQQRNAQLYKLLGSPQGAYQGNLQQNLYLLDQIKKNNYFKSGLPGAKKTTTKTTTPAKTTAQIAAEAAKDVPKVPFEQMLKFEDFFPGDLARSSAAQRTSRYYDPLVQQGQENIMGDYANRGLSRSGARGKSVMDLYKETADQEATMREQLYGAQESQAKEDYGYQRGLYEDNPTGYKKTTASTPTYEYQYPDESPQKYSSSYKNWLKSAFKI